MRRVQFIILAILFAFPLGCSTRSRSDRTNTRVRFLHGSTDLDRLYFVVDDLDQAALVRSEMSGYIGLRSGRRLLDVWDETEIVFSALVDIESGVEQTFALVGSRSSKDLTVVQILDPVGPTAPNTARISLFHASPDAPGLDLDIDGKTVFQNVRYMGDHSIPAWATVDGGLLTFTLKETSGRRRRFGPFTYDVAPGRDLTVAVTNPDAQLEFRTWNDLAGVTVDPGSRVRGLNASPELGPIEVRLDGRPLVTGVPFREASSYLATSSGVHDLEIRSGSTLRVSGSFTAQSGYDYTVAVTGDPVTPTAIIHPDGPFIVDPGAFVFDVFHLGRDAGRIDLRVNGAWPRSLLALPYLGSNPSPTPPDPLLVDRANPAARVDIFEAFLAGTQGLIGRADLVPSEDGVYSIVLLGNRTVNGSIGVGDTATDLLVFDEAEDGRRLARIRTGHAAPTRDSLTFKVDGSTASDAISPALTYLGGIGFPAAYVHLGSGPHTLTVTPTGSSSALVTTPLDAEPGVDTTDLVVEASVANPVLALTTVDDPDGPFPPTPSTARLRLHHAARGVSATALDLYLNAVSGAPLIGNVSHSNASGYVEIPSGTNHTLILTPAGNPGQTLYTLPGVRLEAGRDASFVALATNSAQNLTESVLLADN
jgi:hypothetical protein